MGKAGKQKRSAVRRAAKKARKTANYLRCGPKDTSRQKRRKSMAAISLVTTVSYTALALVRRPAAGYKA